MNKLFTFELPEIGTRMITGDDDQDACNNLQQRLDSEGDESEPHVKVTAEMITAREEHPGLDEFTAKYTPVTNPANGESSPPASFMFETYGEELEHINGLDHRRVWTLIDGGEGPQWLIAGRHFVNRIGYFVTEAVWADADETYLYAA